ncbi:MAG: regulatory protein RecX [Bacteroidales bacterium]|nr:regulatory protein RecX [Bacteroidales bacterium]
MNSENYNTALNRAMALCSKSEKCISDIENKLRSWKLSSDEENKAIIRTLKEEKFIDEKRYARSYTMDKYRFNKWGKIKIRAMLRARGLNEEDIAYGTEAIDDDSYLQMIEEEMRNKKRSVKAAGIFELKGKLFRFASSRGYEKEHVYGLIDRLTS